MKQIATAGEWIARGIVLLNGRRSPWGGASASDSSASGSSGDEASGGTPSGGDEPRDESGPAAPAPTSGLPGDAGRAASAGPSGDAPASDTPVGRGNRPSGLGPWSHRADDTPGNAPRRPSAIDGLFRRPQGNSGGGAGPQPPFNLPPRANGKSWAPLLAGGFAALWLLITGTHQLGSTEQGIVTTFGKYERTVGPGVSLTLPWPIQTVTTVDVTSIRRDSIPDGEAEKLMLTSDQNLVDFSYLVRWNIKDLKLYSFQLDNPDATVREVAEAAMRASVSEVPLNDVMGGAGRSEIEQAVRSRMQAILDAYRSGVLIQGVDIKKADPPEKVVAAFQQVTVAQQGAQRDMSNAQAYAQQVVARAQGDAAAFDKVYTQYKLSPAVTRRRMYYETMERVLSNNDKVIMEGNTTSYLPLPEARRRGPSVEVSSGTGGGGQ